MFSWSPKQQDGLISISQDKLVALVMDSPCIVRILTDDFSTLLECVCKIDQNKDGKIVFEELKPLLLRVLQGEEEISAMQALFDVLDLNQDGYITVVELYAARLGLRKLIEQEVGQEADPGDYSIDGQSIDGVKGKKKHSLCEKGASGRLTRAISAKWRWVTIERWQNDGTLVELRRTRDAKGDSDYSEASALLWETLSTHLAADTYEFQPGAVDIPTYIDGSGALLEYRVDQIVRSVADCTREVRASSHAAGMNATHFELALMYPRPRWLRVDQRRGLTCAGGSTLAEASRDRGGPAGGCRGAPHIAYDVLNLPQRTFCGASFGLLAHAALC